MTDVEAPPTAPPASTSTGAVTAADIPRLWQIATRATQKASAYRDELGECRREQDAMLGVARPPPAPVEPPSAGPGVALVIGLTALGLAVGFGVGFGVGMAR